MSNCVVSDNVAEADLNNNTGHTLLGNSCGGGLFNSGTASVSQCTFTGNAASYNDQQNAANNSFDVVSAYGGAIDNVGVLTLANSILNNKNAGSQGSALYNSGQATVSGSIFSQNVGTIEASRGSGYLPVYSYGGAIDNDKGVLSLNNCTVANNVAGITFTPSFTKGLGVCSGGGIYSLGELSITSCTITGNSVSTTAPVGVTTIVEGGGVCIDPSSPDPARLLNTIISGNSSTMLGPDVFGTFTSLGHNLIGKTDGSSGWVNSDLVGTSANPLDAMLGPLQDNGGPTQTMALLPGSPAIHTGDPSLAGTLDQRGVPRTGGVNIGAYQASASAFDVGAPAQATTGVPFDVTVTAVDVFNQTAVGYTGTVHFTSSDSQALLPADYTFTAGDDGAYTFPNGVTLITAGNQTITATDTANSTITGNAAVTVSAPPTPPPGGDATGPQTPITNLGQPAQQIVLLDRLFSLLSARIRPSAWHNLSTRGWRMIHLAVMRGCLVQLGRAGSLSAHWQSSDK